MKGTVYGGVSSDNIRIIEANTKLDAMRKLLNDVLQGDNFTSFEIYQVY